MYKKLLSDILTNVTINHKQEILNCKTLKEAHIYCKVNCLNGQTTGSLIESYIIGKSSNIRKINSSECKGDCIVDDLHNVEIKVSLGGNKHKNFNYVQIRLGHDIQYYLLTAYYISESNLDNEGELYTFCIDKASMKNILIEYGQYAHGTIKENGVICADNIREDKEYALRVSYDSSLWKKLCEYKLTNSDLPIEFCRAVSSLTE